MSDLPKIPAEAKEIIKNKRTGKVYKTKEEFDDDFKLLTGRDHDGGGY